jgi:hypothetical protein
MPILWMDVWKLYGNMWKACGCVGDGVRMSYNLVDLITWSMRKSFWFLPHDWEDFS